MKKRISALLLSAVLCFALVGTAFAANNEIAVNATTNGVTLNGTLAEAKDYLMCSVTDAAGQPLVLFNIYKEQIPDGKVSNFVVPVTLSSNQSIKVSIINNDGTPVSTTETTVRGGSAGGGGGGGGGSVNTYSVTVNPVANGSVSVSPNNAAKGEKVTITVKPSEGYVLDTLTVKDANGNVLTLTKVNDTTYTFLMPNTRVTVDASFKLADGAEISFSDVASDYTFYNDIMWVAGKGFMQGYDDGTFRPNNNTTRQALWMVLARIDGANPSSMTAARTWAMNSNVSDGTNPTNPMSRQQMVTMLYRYAQMKGYATSGGISIAGYPDAASVASYAKDAMSWAVGNGIVQGTTSGALNPTGTASRAHFAAFLHRFCTTAGIA